MERKFSVSYWNHEMKQIRLYPVRARSQEEAERRAAQAYPNKRAALEVELAA